MEPTTTPPPETPSSLPATPTAQPPTPPPGDQLTAPKKSRKTRVLVLAFAGLLLVVGGVAYILISRSANDNSANQQAKKSIPLLKVGITEPFPEKPYPHDTIEIFPAQVDTQIYEALTRYQNDTQVTPGLAESWSNPNSTTWDFKLKPGITFHDGHVLNAKAVKSSLDALLPTDFGDAYGGSIKSVTAVDDQTVRIETAASDALLPNELANLWIYDTQAGDKDKYMNGTGPYIVKPGTQINTKTIDLVASPGYYGGEPYVKEINFKFYADSKSMTPDLKNGSLDIADMQTIDDLNQAKKYGYETYLQQVPVVFFVLPNTQRAGSPLQNLKVRQAIYEAIDPQQILKIDGQGGIAATQFVPQVIPGFNPAIQRPKLDPVKAKADLAAAGYPNGITLKFTYLSPRQDIAEELQKELAPIGVKLSLDPVSDYGDKALGGGTDLVYLGYGSDFMDTSDVIQTLLINSANYKNPALDTLYNKAAATLNQQERLQSLQQINKLAMDDVAAFPIFVRGGNHFAIKPNIVAHSDDLTVYAGIDFWKVYSTK
jgi:peptide/nickel transport system substrate-binding protein